MNYTKKQINDIIKEEINLFLENNKDNPWAICTASVGREDKDKYEKCVLSVKKNMNEQEEIQQDKLTTSDAKKRQRSRVKKVGDAGITDAERGLIDALQQRLLAAAEKSNIGSGKILRLSQILAKEIAKVLKTKGN